MSLLEIYQLYACVESLLLKVSIVRASKCLQILKSSEKVIPRGAIELEMTMCFLRLCENSPFYFSIFETPRNLQN